MKTKATNTPKAIYDKVLSSLRARPTKPAGYEEMLALLREDLEKNPEYVQKQLKEMCRQLDKHIVNHPLSLYEVHRKTLKMYAPFNFEAFLMFTEWNRQAENKFYMPRRKQLRPVVQALQDLADDKLDLLAISLPPGVGKSTLALFFITWLAGRKPMKSILTASHNKNFVDGAYDECLRMLDPNGEYLFNQVFPAAQICSTNAKDCRIDLMLPKRFESLEFTTLGSGNAGLYRAQQLLYCDDLVSGIEVAMSKDRLDSVWRAYYSDLRQRKQGTCKELHIATRWSVYDVIGRLERINQDNKRAKFLCIPALDEKNRSNFDYPYGVGFDTHFFLEQKRVLDDATFQALYMNQPIEREGQLYDLKELRRFYDLPEGDPDAILSVCDTKDTGTDYCVCLVGYKYGDDIYIKDCVCDNGKPDVVDEKVAGLLLNNNVQMAQFESNNVGRRVADKIRTRILTYHGRTRITTKFSGTNKETRIIVNSPFVKNNFLFLADEVVSHEYRKMLDMMVTYSMLGRNKHDDVPDALALFAEYVQNLSSNATKVFQRPF